MRGEATAIPIPTIMTDSLRPLDIIRLSAWLSPAFPVGAFTYSSGLEYAVEANLVGDAEDLRDWLETMLRDGLGAIEGGLFAHAHRAARSDDHETLAAAIEWGAVLRPTAELALESAAQGEAFLKTLAAAWPHPGVSRFHALLAELDRPPAYSVAVGTVCGYHGLPLAASLAAFLHAVIANLVSAGIRLVPLGQTGGQWVMAALEPVLAEAVETAQDRSLDDLGAATAMVDWTSMQHETQYTRLFRS